MSDIQVPDEVIEEAARASVIRGNQAFISGVRGEPDLTKASLQAAAPIIAAWAREQALSEARAAVDALVVTGGQDVNIDDVQATIDSLLAETEEQS